MIWRFFAFIIYIFYIVLKSTAGMKKARAFLHALLVAALFDSSTPSMNRWGDECRIDESKN